MNAQNELLSCAGADVPRTSDGEVVRNMAAAVSSLVKSRALRHGVRTHLSGDPNFRLDEPTEDNRTSWHY